MDITGSLRFWLTLYENRPIYHRQSTEIPPTVNGQRIGRVSAAISADSRTICRPTRSRYRGRCIGRYVDRHISVGISAECRLICRPTYRSSVGRYIGRYIGRLSVDMSTDISIEGCTKYTWSNQLFWKIKKAFRGCFLFTVTRTANLNISSRKNW